MQVKVIEYFRTISLLVITHQTNGIARMVKYISNYGVNYEPALNVVFRCLRISMASMNLPTRITLQSDYKIVFMSIGN